MLASNSTINDDCARNTSHGGPDLRTVLYVEGIRSNVEFTFDTASFGKGVLLDEMIKRCAPNDYPTGSNYQHASLVDSPTDHAARKVLGELAADDPELGQQLVSHVKIKPSGLAVE